MKWFVKAVKAHPGMFQEEPKKTVLTMAALAAGNVLPRKVFDRLVAKVLGGSPAGSAGGKDNPLSSTQEKAA